MLKKNVKRRRKANEAKVLKLLAASLQETTNHRDYPPCRPWLTYRSAAGCAAPCAPGRSEVRLMTSRHFFFCLCAGNVDCPGIMDPASCTVPEQKQKQNDYRLKSPERLVCDGTLMRNVSALGSGGKRQRERRKKRKKEEEEREEAQNNVYVLV